jgi:hypothetical protein
MVYRQALAAQFVKNRISSVKAPRLSDLKKELLQDRLLKVFEAC